MTLRDRLLAKSVDGAGGCRIWRGARFPNGYGKITVGSAKDGSRRVAGAHRVAYEAFVGPIPPGLCVLHSCDVRDCIEPAHFFLGTDADNANDRDAKGRTGRPRGEANGAAKLTVRNVRAIRRAISAGAKHRELAARYRVTRATITKIANGSRWSHVPEGV